MPMPVSTPLYISRPMFRGYMRHMFFWRQDWVDAYVKRQQREPREFEPPAIRDRRSRHPRVVINPDHRDTMNVFLQTLIARHLKARGLIQLEEDYTDATMDR
jgi:hypothetical protein